MPKFRKKPVEIEAVQYTEHGKLIKGMCNSQSCLAQSNCKSHCHINDKKTVNLDIGDWIVQEKNGEFSPYAQHFFELIYEPV